MSVVAGVKNRAEDALEQGKHAVGAAQKSAQSRLSDAVDVVSNVAEKTASRDVTVAGRTVSFESIVADLEDLIKRYRASANDRADAFVSDIKNDDRVAKLIDRAEAIVGELKADKRITQVVERVESVYDALVDTVQDRVVKPTQGLVAKTPAKKARGKKVAPAKKATPTRAAAKKAPARKAANATTRKASPKKASI